MAIPIYGLPPIGLLPFRPPPFGLGLPPFGLLPLRPPPNGLTPFGQPLIGLPPFGGWSIWGVVQLGGGGGGVPYRG